VNQTELITRARIAAYLETANVDFTDAVILQELNDQMSQLYEATITKSRQGYWLKQLLVPIVAGQDRYRMPYRSCIGGLERLEIAYDSTLDWQPLDLVDEKLAINYELQTGQRGQVVRYCMRGDQINLLPDPDGSSFALRLNYYIRPGRIVAAQSTPTTAGVITSINLGARTVTMAAVPQSVDTTGVLSTIFTGALIDIIAPTGWHELQVVSEPISVSGTTYTLTGTSDMSTVQVGDVVRIAEQTDWPALPDDFHRSIADAAAISILRTRGMSDRSGELRTKLGETLASFADMMSPRVQASAPIIVAPNMYRGQRRGGMLVKYP